MPALLDDPTSPVIYRASGAQPFPTAQDPQIPSSIFPRAIALRDRVTVATLVPFFSPTQVPARLLSYLCETLNKEIEGGDTYPMINPLPVEAFGPYWFGNFAAVMIRGDIGGIESVQEMESNGTDWSKLCLGSFYVKPNYPGRSSHVCNGGFLVTPAARNKGVGKSMGECYLDWAPQLVRFLRATLILFSIWFTRRILRQHEFGTLSASNVLEGSQDVATSDRQMNQSPLSSTAVTWDPKAKVLSLRSASTKSEPTEKRRYTLQADRCGGWNAREVDAQGQGSHF